MNQVAMMTSAVMRIVIPHLLSLRKFSALLTAMVSPSMSKNGQLVRSRVGEQRPRHTLCSLPAATSTYDQRDAGAGTGSPSALSPSI